MADMKTDDALVAYVARWHDIHPPNEFAHRAAADLAKVMADLAAIRGALRFEDEPASFELALLEASGLPGAEWEG